MPYTVIATGSQSWHDRTVVFGVLDQVAEETRPWGPLVVRHGGCSRGADLWVAAWCRRHPQVVEQRRPADWATCPPPCTGNHPQDYCPFAGQWRKRVTTRRSVRY